jgi:hypothetical protein
MRKPSQAGWNHAHRIALAALAGYVEPSVGTATHYHTVWVVPYWAWTVDKVTTLGAHIFYRWKGYWGKRAAFTGAYAGEPAGVGRMLVGPYMSIAPIEDSLQGNPRLLGRGSHLRADETGSLMAVAPIPAGEPALRPRADRESGTLKIDENARALAGAAVKVP